MKNRNKINCNNNNKTEFKDIHCHRVILAEQNLEVLFNLYLNAVKGLV